MEILGCYHPVTVTEIPSISHTSPPPEFTHCRPCSNVPQEQLNIDNCACSPSQSWDGKQCVMPSLCPCFDGPIKYSVGTMFHSQHNCSSCVCTLGGVSDCRSQTCPQCDHGFVTEAKSPQCQCSCKACDQGTRALVIHQTFALMRHCGAMVNAYIYFQKLHCILVRIIFFLK